MAEWIDKQRTLNPDAPRLIYGRNTPNQPVKPFETEMNATALPLLEADPSLVTFSGTTPKTGPLITAARQAANQSYTQKGGWTKGKGSRAQGVAGEAGGLGLAAPQQNEHARSVANQSTLGNQSTPVQKMPRISPAVRATELEKLPRQITDLHNTLEAMRRQQQQLNRRGSQDDLLESMKLGEQIAAKQIEVGHTTPSSRLVPCHTLPPRCRAAPNAPHNRLRH